MWEYEGHRIIRTALKMVPIIERCTLPDTKNLHESCSVEGSLELALESTVRSLKQRFKVSKFLVMLPKQFSADSCQQMALETKFS